MKPKALLLLGILASLLISCLVFLPLGVLIGRLWQEELDAQYSAQAVASRLGVEPDWQIIARHVHCDQLALGLTLAEVESNLTQVGPYTLCRTDSLPYYTVYFDEYFTRREVGDLYLSFYNNDRLTEKLKWVGLGETIPLLCP